MVVCGEGPQYSNGQWDRCPLTLVASIEEPPHSGGLWNKFPPTLVVSGAVSPLPWWSVQHFHLTSRS